MNHVTKQGLLFNLSVALCMLGGSPLLVTFLFSETAVFLVWGVTIHWILLFAGILVFVKMTRDFNKYVTNPRRNKTSG